MRQRTDTKSMHALEALIHTYQSRLLHLALSYLRDFQLAEDCVQDVFIKAITHLDFEQPPDRIIHWLLTCTANRSKTMLKSASLRRLVPMAKDHLERVADSHIDCYESLDESGILGAVLRLPLKYREVLYLKYYQGLSNTDISSILILSDEALKTRLRRAKQRLKMVFAEGGVIHG